jgi:4-aminobutyrate aminotransferase-like enzyme/Ser/Thr protein kinase RdoA (MazF antagonist)
MIVENGPDPVLGALLSDAYGIEGCLSPLGGEHENVLVEAADGRRFVLKRYAVGDESSIDFEHALAEHVASHLPDVSVPQTVRTRSDDLCVRTGNTFVRLLTYIPGTPWECVPDASLTRLRDLGRVIASVDCCLTSFAHPVPFRSHQWDLTTAGEHRALVRYVASRARRRLVETLFHRWAALAAPRLPALPSAVIHGDINDENVLVDAERVIGLLDFSDAVVNPIVCDLAIALAYAMLDVADPLAAGATVVAGYQAVRPLSNAELDVLFPLVCGRTATTATIAAERHQLDAANPNWFVTEDRAWRLIERLVFIEPGQARSAFDAAVRGVAAGPLGPARHEAFDGTHERLLAKRRRHLSRALLISYHDPVHIVRGEGQYLFDRGGRRYLDLVNNVALVGHCHPHVVEAGQCAMARLNTNTRYLYDELTEYAERLSATLPAPLDVCFFVNSGSEAGELALRLARAHTRRRDVVVVEHAYHGNTSTLIAASPYKFMGKGGPGAPEPWVHVARAPDGYRGPYRGRDLATGRAYGDEVHRAVATSASPVAAFLVESMMSCAGHVIPPPGYLERAFQAVRDAGGVCIADEVQIGFGRAGTHFWGFELQGVVPDIVVMGKPIGNGHPLGAVVTTREIAASFENGMEFFSTFGGNPVSCAIGLAVLDVVRDQQLQWHAARVGAHMLSALQTLAETHPLIGDVRGAGLFIGVELVRDRETLEPATREANDLINRLRHRGALLGTDGPYRNVLKIKPPLVITEADVELFVDMLGEELRSIQA